LRYPADFDGIVAGAPALNLVHLHVGSLWIAQAVHQTPESYIPPSKYGLIHQAALNACDALDGVRDGLIENPLRCRFDPGVLACKDGDAADCLTPAQVEAARKIYRPAKNPRTGQEIYPGLEPGSELGWSTLSGPEPLSLATDTFKYLVFKDPNWDYLTLNFDSDVGLADKLAGGAISVTDPDLKKFVEKGGKLILYHGWSDPSISPANTANYYQSVVAALGGRAKAANSVRLFMVPGMGHCRGGEGLCNFDMMGPIEQWVEKGKAPGSILASHTNEAGKVDRTRPLCHYPEVAHYKGTGSTDDAANFVCGDVANGY
jgi:feruloyl esterase